MIHRHWLLGIALVATTSCMPPEGRRGIARVPRPAVTTNSRQLLRQLALDVPDRALPDALPEAVPVKGPATAALAAPPFLAASHSLDDATRALDCLTAAVYYEARSEAVDGQRAVAQVVLNRVRDRAFPRSVCGVVYQGSNRSTGCQFSFSCDGSMAYRRDPAAWDRARLVAQAALDGSVYAPVGSATFYHTRAVSPWWAPSLARIGTIGSHIFYTWRGALERALAFRQDYAGTEPAAAPLAATPTAVAANALVSEETGVTVHRGRSDAEPTAQVPQSTGRSVVAGVRIHVGMTMASPAPPQDSDPI